MIARLPATLLAVALALPAAVSPAQAQGGTGARVAPSRGEAFRPDATRQGSRVAPLADSIEDPSTLIRLAEAALGARRTREALELLERAESRLLTRSELATAADRPAVGGAIGDLAAARDAIARRDASGAQGLLATALRRLDSGEGAGIVTLPEPAATGPTPAPAPAWGGGAPAAHWGGGALAPLPGIAPQNMPVGGSASRPVPIGPDVETPKSQPLPGSVPPASSKPPPS